jgi:hypothetical protein
VYIYTIINNNNNGNTINKKPKIYTIQTRKSYCRVQREDSVNVTTGTIEELSKYFGYTLEIGNSWNRKIKRYPTTIKALEKNLQMSYEEKEASCYDRTSVSVIETSEEEKTKYYNGK